MIQRSSLIILMIIFSLIYGCSNISGTITIDGVPLKDVEVTLSEFNETVVCSVVESRKKA